MRYATLIAISGLLVSAAAAPSFAAQPTAQERSGDKLVCKSKPKTGTRFRTKTCRTVSEWDQIAEGNKRAMADVVNRPQIKVCGPMTGCD